MSTPKVLFFDLEIAFHDSSYERHYWLDKQTGNVILIDEEVAEVLREGEDLSVCLGGGARWRRRCGLCCARLASCPIRRMMKLTWVAT